MDPLAALVVDVKTVLSATKPLNAGSLIKAGVKLCLDSKALTGLSHDKKIALLMKAMVMALTELKEKELAECSADQKAAVNDRYAHLSLVAESGLPAVLETVHEIFSGKLSLTSLVSQMKPASWFSWFSCVATSAVSTAAAAGLVSEKQAADAAAVVKTVEDAPKKVEEVAAKAEAVLAQAKAAVPALAPVTDAVAAVVDKVEAAAAAVAPVAPAVVVVDLSGSVQVPAPEATVVTSPPETAPVENKQ
jgi:hypothetical protein